MSQPTMEQAEQLRHASMTYSTFAVEPPLVRDAVARIWNDNLALRATPEERFDWVFRKAPWPPSHVYVVRARLPGGPSEIVGTAGVSERRFESRYGTLRAAHLVDLAVDAEHRRVGPALSLLRCARQDALDSHAFAYGFPNAAARAVFRRVGYRPLAPVTRWVRVLRHAPYLRERVGRLVLPRLSGALLDSVAHAAQVQRRLSAWAHFTLEVCADADQRFDALWRRAHQDYDVISRRDARFLHWRFLDPAMGRCELLGLHRRGRAAELCAYAVVEWHDDTAHLRDLFGEPAHLGTMLDLLLPWLRDRGARCASLMFLGSRAAQDVLRERGFWPRDNERIAFFDTRSPDMLEHLANPDCWYLTDADDDA